MRPILLIIGLLLACPAWLFATSTCPDGQGGTLTCTNWASSSGTGTACTDSDTGGTPCTVAEAVSQWSSSGGTVTCLKDGTYTGIDSMFHVTDFRNGTTDETDNYLCAETDGGVTFDGEFTETPVDIVDSDNITGIGFDAIRGSTDTLRIRTSGGCAALTNGCGPSYITMRRVQAAETTDDDENKVWEVIRADHFLFVDWSAMGQGRKTAHNFQSYAGVWRRGYLRYDGMDTPNNKEACMPSYCGADILAENVICDIQWKPTVTMGGSFSAWMGNRNGTSGHGCDGRIQTYGEDLQLKHYGILLMQRDEVDNGFANYFNVFGRYRMDSNFNEGFPVSDTDVRDSVFYRDVGVPGENSSPNIQATSCQELGTPCASETNSMTRVIAVGGTTPVITTSPGWSLTNVAHYDTPGDLSGDRIFTVGGTLPNLCNRYKDGVLTSDPLWTWPMESRVKALLTTLGYTGEFAKGPTEIVEAEFGAIPAACIAGAAGSAAPGIMLHGLTPQGITFGK